MASPKSRSKTKHSSTAPENSVRNTVLLSLLLLVIGFGSVWAWLSHAQRQEVQVQYLTLERVAISRDGHSMAATVAIRTSAGAADWAASQKQALEEVVKLALMEADPVASRGPDGIARLQQAITETSRRMLKTDRVQEAVITDFVVSEGDY